MGDNASEGNGSDARHLRTKRSGGNNLFKKYLDDDYVEFSFLCAKDAGGVTDVYGFGGWQGDYLTRFLMSNGTYVAATAAENITSPEAAEVLQFVQGLNLVHGVM